MDIIKKISKSYEYVLVGYNLTSLSFAIELAKEKKSFCLIDSKHFGSNPFKSISSLDLEVYTRVPFVGLNETSLPKIKNSLFSDALIVESTPLIFDKGEFKSFLGFGDTKIESLDAALTFCQTKNLQTPLTPEIFWHDHKDLIKNQLFLDQKLTDIVCVDKQVKHLILNGQFQLEADHFYFFDQFPMLFEKIGQQEKKRASQFAKTNWFSSISLIIHHKEKPENFELNQVYLLKGSKEQPCLGQFTDMSGELISRWESFFPIEQAADDEMIGTCLKEIKKQIKRAFSIPDKVVNPEHIVIQNQVYAEMGKSGIISGKLGSFSNLHIYSPLFSSEPGWVFEVLTGLNAHQDLLGLQKNEDSPRIEVAEPHAPC